MRHNAAFDLPPRFSQARHWRQLAAEVHDALVDAMHHPQVLSGRRQPRLRLETSARWLPANRMDTDLQALHHALAAHGIEHNITSRRDAGWHRIELCLVRPEATVSRPSRPERITHRVPSSTTPRSTAMRVEPRFSMPTPDSLPLKKAKPPAEPPKRSWLSRLAQWLFGPPSAFDPPPKGGEDFEHGGETVTNNPPRFEVKHNGNYLDSFYTALTQATAQFIRTWVEPFHKEDASYVFSITAIKVAMVDDAAYPYLDELEVIPAEVLNNVAKIRLKQAHGHEQIRLDNFFGLSIVPDNALLGRRAVETLVSYAKNRVLLRFQFDGEYLTLPPANAPRPGEDGKNGQSLGGYSKEDTPLAGSATAYRKEDTPLSFKADTFFRPKAVARLRIKPWGGEETEVELTEDDFPYILGREPSGRGFELAPAGAPPTQARHVSREHLALMSYDALGGCLLISNSGRNGSYDHEGRVLPERFIHKLGAVGHGICLGGKAGEGTVQIALELP
jgi:hypothetical protein